MAHLAKFKASAVAGMMHHYARDRQGTLDRPNIDESRTPLNYVIGRGDGAEEVARRIERAQEAAGRSLRKDANVLADLVVTKPQNVLELDEREFFQSCYDFMAEQVGEQNMLGGWVHMDEKTPHIHLAFTPMVGDSFNYNQVFPRAKYRTLHPALSDFVEQRLGYRAEIKVDEDDRGRKQLSHLDQEEYKQATRSLERLRRAEADLAQEVSDLQSARNPITESAGQIAKADAESPGLRRRIETLESEVRDARRRAEALERKVVRCQASQREEEATGRSLDETLGSLRARVEELAVTLREMGVKVIHAITDKWMGDFLDKVGFEHTNVLHQQESYFKPPSWMRSSARGRGGEAR